MTHLPDNPDQLVFSGGGLRCFWQGGVMDVLDDHAPLKPKRITGVSGGALASVAWLGGMRDGLLNRMCAAFEDRDSNLDLFNADEDGITPHQRMYCRVVDEVVTDAVQRRIANGPALQILIAYPPDNALPATLTGTALAAAYEAELHSVGSPYFSWAEKRGLTAQLIDANAAARDGRLVDRICAAAVIPPVFEPPLWNGRRVVDGGMADQAPMPDPDDGTTLVLLTREYKRIPEHPNRSYLFPSEETEADKIDFTDPQKLKSTWAQGRSDAEAWIKAMPKTA